MRRGWVLILGVCLLVYANSLSNSFHYDDEHSIQQNIYIRSLANIPAFFADPASFSVDAEKAMYRPVLLVTYALNYAAGGSSVLGYHLVNLLLHGLNACLVWWLALLLGGRPRIALLAGLLFAAHPIATEPVNYLCSRSESLAAFFYLLGLGLFIRAGDQDRWGTRAASGASLLLGLLSKETVITLPAVLLVYDYLFLSQRRWGQWRGHLRRHALYWLAAVGYVLVITANQFLPRSLGRPVRDSATQLLTQLKALTYYLHRLAWPVDLSVEPQFFEQQAALVPVVLVSLLLWGSVALLGVYLYRRRRDVPLFLLLWGLLVLVPVLVMPLNVLVNERRLYLSAAALCLGVAWLLDRGGMKRLSAGKWQAGQVAGLVLLLLFGGLSWQRSRVWKDEFSLWQDAAAKGPLMPRVHLYLGNAYKDAAQAQSDWPRARPFWQAALQEYAQTVRLGGRGELAMRALNNMGSVQFSLNNLEAAELAYRKAVELDPHYADGLVNLGSICLARSRQTPDQAARQQLLEEAIHYCQQALGISPNHFAATMNLGVARQDQGEYDQAQRLYEQALFLKPDDPEVLANLGTLSLARYRQAGSAGRPYLLQARGLFQRALAVQPSSTAARQGLQQAERLLSESP